MGSTFERLDDRLREFILAQRVFFVATAPLDQNGHINCSPKGLDALRILGPRCVAYLDYPGSGIETVAHLRENGRILLMLCGFQGPPRIVRLHGRGQTITPDHDEFSALLAHFAAEGSVRSIIRVELSRISDSCGYGVPLLKYQQERTQLTAWSRKLGPEKLSDYARDKNARSIDGLPGLS